MDTNERNHKALAMSKAIGELETKSNEWYGRALSARPRSVYFKVCCKMGDMLVERAQSLRQQNAQLTPIAPSKN